MLKRWFGTGPDLPHLQDDAKVDQLYRRSRTQIMIAITFGYGMAYTCRLPLSIVKKPLIDGGIFTAQELGWIGAGLLYGYGFGKLLNGFLADHANIKRFFSFGLFGSALVNLLMGWGISTSVGLWTALWAFNGWFQGFGAPASGTVLSNWFTARERGTYYGIWSTAHAIGEGLTFYVTAALVSAVGWHAGFWGPGATCVVIALLLYVFLLDRPATMGLPPVETWKGEPAQPSHGPSDQPLTPGQAQMLVVKSPAIWIMGLSNAMMYVTRYAVNNWGILYLQEARGYSLKAAGLFLTINTAAGIIGSVAYGVLSDRVFAARRPPANLLFGILEIASLFLIFFSPPKSPYLLAFAYALYGFSLSGILASIGGLFAIDLAPRKAAGAAMGFIGVFGYLGAAIQDQISGTLIHRGTTVVNGVKHYDFGPAITFWIGASILSLILAATLWRVRPKD